MKKTIGIRRIAMLLAVLMAVLMAAGCAPEPEPLTKDEVQALRKDFPAVSIDPTLDYAGSETMDNYSQYNAAWAVVTVTGNWKRNETIDLPPADGLKPIRCKTPYLPVRIESIVEDRNSEFKFETGDRVLRFPGSLQDEEFKALTPGKRFVMFICEETAPTTAFPGHYGGDTLGTFYLTDDDHLISLVELPPYRNYDGWTLKAFQKYLKSISWRPESTEAG